MRSTKLNLKESICTDTPVGADLWQLGNDAARHLVNTGMERNGGLTPIYEKETTFPTAGVSTMIAKDGTVVQVDASNNVRLNDQVIGNVGPLAIAKRGSLPGYLDAAWTADATLLAINRIGTSIYVYEIDPATGSILHSRSNAFAGFPSATIANICLVKYVDMHYVDNQEFIVQPAGVNAQSYILKESGTSTTICVSNSAVYYCWRFAAAKYIFGQSGASWLIGDFTGGNSFVSTGASSPTTNVSWIIIDRFPGTAFSRAILTLNPVKNNANLFSGYGEVGYTSAGVYSATPVFYGIALGAVTVTVNNPVVGPGYVECSFVRSDTGAIIYSYYAAPFAHNIAAYYATQTTYTNTPINAYGKLTDLFNTTTGANNTNLVAWRVLFNNGIASTLSAAPVGATWDCIGIPITNVGEFDDSFVPHVDDNGSTYSRILYRYNGLLFYVSITTTATHILQKVSDSLYTVDCLSALNAIDIKNKKLSTGVNDYNGRLVWGVGNATTTTYKVVGITQGNFSNSIDNGDKLSTAIFGSSLVLGNEVQCPGIDPPSFWDRQNDFAVNFYMNDVYYGSFKTYNAPFFKSDLMATLYVPDTRDPFGMGYSFLEGHTLQTEIETIFTGVGVIGSADINFDYLCYEIGNDIPGLFQGFQLFGQTYIFDGQNIWLTAFQGSLFNGRGNVPICGAAGMQLIAVAPTEVFFLSPFDNSLYSYNGGRSLSKQVRMNSQDIISGGVFSTRDNSLLLNGTNSFIWIRDSIVSENAKKANQAGTLGLYDTINGITIANLGTYPDPTKNLIDRGDCGSATAPMVSGETVPATDGCLWYWNGGNTWLLKRQVGAGNFAHAFQTSDASSVNLHGFIPGHTYTYVVKLNVPSAGSFIATDGFLEARYYVSGSWSYAQVFFANIYDDQQTVAVTFTVPVGATGCEIDIVGGYNSPNNSYFNVNDITLTDPQSARTTSWIYSFFALSGSTIVPFTWQSGYLGITENKLGVFADYVFTLYSSDSSAAAVMFTFDGFDIDGEWHEEIPYAINPGDWTPKGFYRGRIVPTHTLGLALSIGLRTSNHIVLVEVIAEFTPSVSATPSAARSQ